MEKRYRRGRGGFKKSLWFDVKRNYWRMVRIENSIQIRNTTRFTKLPITRIFYDTLLET